MDKAKIFLGISNILMLYSLYLDLFPRPHQYIENYIHICSTFGSQKYILRIYVYWVGDPFLNEMVQKSIAIFHGKLLDCQRVVV